MVCCGTFSSVAIVALSNPRNPSLTELLLRTSFLSLSRRCPLLSCCPRYSDVAASARQTLIYNPTRSSIASPVLPVSTHTVYCIHLPPSHIPSLPSLPLTFLCPPALLPSPSICSFLARTEVFLTINSLFTRPRP